MIPVKDNKGLFRDEKTNSIINRDDTQYDQYLRLKQQKMSEKNELEMLKQDIKEIKSALSIILDKINT